MDDGGRFIRWITITFFAFVVLYLLLGALGLYRMANKVYQEILVIG